MTSSRTSSRHGCGCPKEFDSAAKHGDAHPRVAGVIAATAAGSAFFNSTYCSQLRYTVAPEFCQVMRMASATAASGKLGMSSSCGFEMTFSLKSDRILVAAAPKYLCGMVGYVSRSFLKNLLMSRRYSLSKVRVPYSG